MVRLIQYWPQLMDNVKAPVLFDSSNRPGTFLRRVTTT